MSKADEAVAVMEKAGVTRYNKLTNAQASELKTIAKEAADVIDAKLVFKSGSVEIYDANGKLIETVAQNNGKLAYTGNNSFNSICNSNDCPCYHCWRKKNCKRKIN